MLNIVPAGEPRIVSQVVMCLYGDTGTGKTTLALTSEAPLLLDFDRGGHRALPLPHGIAEAPTWGAVRKFDQSQLSPYRTIVIDTAGKLVRSLMKHTTDSDYKLRTKAGNPTIQGWQAINTAFVTWLVGLKEQNLDVILIAHAKEETRSEQAFYRPEVPSATCRHELLGECDLLGYMTLDGQERRVVNFSPSVFHFGKNPAQWDPVLVPDQTAIDQPDGTVIVVGPDGKTPDNTMARLLADAKAKMSRRVPAPAQAAAPAAPAAPEQPAPMAQAPAAPAQPDLPPHDTIGDQINRELEDLLVKWPAPTDGSEDPGKQEKGQFWRRAQSLGYEFDNATGRFVKSA